MGNAKIGISSDRYLWIKFKKKILDNEEKLASQLTKETIKKLKS